MTVTYGMHQVINHVETMINVIPLPRFVLCLFMQVSSLFKDVDLIRFSLKTFYSGQLY